MTDIGHKNAEIYISPKRAVASRIVHIKEKYLILFCFSAVAAVWQNSWLAVLPLIIMQLCTDKTAMCICGAASVVCFIGTFMQTAYYVPYAVYVPIYIAAVCLIKDKKISPNIFPLSLFIITKLYLLSFGYQSEYWVVFALEILALTMLASPAAHGVKLLKSNAENLSPADIFCCCCALLPAAAALGGFNVYGFNASACFLLGTAFYFIVKESAVLSMSAALCMGVMLCRERYFTFMFAGFAAIYIASAALLKNNIKGYILTALISAAVTLLLITQFNSFVFLTITAAGLAQCFLMVKFCKVVPQSVRGDCIIENDYSLLAQKIDKLNRCFNFLGHTVADISNLMVNSEIPADICDSVAQAACRKCKNNMLCWQDNYGHTQTQFAECAAKLQKGAQFKFDSVFTQRCDKTDRLQSQFRQAIQLDSTRRLIYRCGRHNQKIMQSQFLTLAQVLKDITYQSRRTGVVNSAYTHTVNGFLHRIGVNADYCVCYQNKSRCIISTRDILDSQQLEKIRLKLENVYNAKFGQGVKTDEGDSLTYTFVETAMFSCESGAAASAKHNVSGDEYCIFSSDDYTYIILADGMGTGSYAAAESRTAVAMLKNLLTAGVNPTAALDIANTALNLKGTGQACAAVDILRIDCYSGECTSYKAGAAPSVVMDKGKIKKLYRDSLPIGILKDTKVERMDFVLNNGDIVVLVSDGVLLEKELIYKIRLMSRNNTPQQLAQFIAERQSGADDATAVVVKLIRT